MNIIFLLFLIRLLPLAIAGFVTTKKRDYFGMGICALYMAVTTVNYIYRDPTLNAVFSTPLVFLTSWYLISKNRGKIIRIKMK